MRTHHSSAFKIDFDKRDGIYCDGQEPQWMDIFKTAINDGKNVKNQENNAQ